MKNTIIVATFLVAFGFFSQTAFAHTKCKNGAFYAVSHPCYQGRRTVYVNNPDNVARTAAANAQKTAEAAQTTANTALGKAEEVEGNFNRYSANNEVWKAEKNAADASRDKTIDREVYRNDRQEQSLWWLWAIVTPVGILALVAVMVSMMGRNNNHVPPQQVVHQPGAPAAQPAAQVPAPANQQPFVQNQTFYGVGQNQQPQQLPQPQNSFQFGGEVAIQQQPWALQIPAPVVVTPPQNQPPVN